MQTDFCWKTATIIRETADTITIIFDTGADHFSFKAGQFINLSLNIEGSVVTRSYSLSSSPDDDEKPAVTIKRIPHGRMSNYIFGHAEEIGEWNIDGPHGLFGGDISKPGEQYIVLIGAGSGITPLYSLLKYFLKHTTARILLVDANKMMADVIFGNALGYLENSFPHRLTVWHIFSRPAIKEAGAFNNVLQGRLNKMLLKKILKKVLGEQLGDSSYFLCGPAGYIQLAEETLQSLEIPDANVKKEYFVLTGQPPLKVEKSFSSREVLLEYFEQTHLLVVEPGKSILDAALENKLALKYSCRSGDCGSCIARKLSGQIFMQNNTVIPGEGIAEGYVLLCQSYPLDDQVTVRYA